MSKTELDIKLKTTADLSGAKAVEKALDQVNQAVTKTAVSQDKAAKSGVNMGQALLQGSRGFQDFQAAGLNGLANNLEGIAMGLGLGSGIAGAVTVMAVAVQTLGPKVVAWFNSLDTEGAKLDQLKGRFAGFAEQLRGDFDPAQEASKDASEEFQKSLKKEADEMDELKTATANLIAQLRLKNQIQDTADQNLERRQIEDIRANKNLSPQQAAAQEAAVKQRTLDARKAREEQESAAAIQAAENITNQQGRAVVNTREQEAAKERDLRDTQTMVQYLDPKNRGSVIGLQGQAKAKAAEITRVESEFGDNSLVEQMKADLESINKTLEERQAFIDRTATRTGGKTVQQLADELRDLRKLAEDQEKALQAAGESETKTRQTEAIKAVGRESTYQDKVGSVARDYTQAAFPGQQVFNNPNAFNQPGLGGLPALPGSSPLDQTQPQAPQGRAAAMPGENVLGPLGGQLQQATDAVSNSPLEGYLKEIGSGFTAFGEAVSTQNARVEKVAQEALANSKQALSQIKATR